MDATVDPQVSPEKRADAPKRQKNNMLLLNAMRTTAAHSKMSFTASSVALPTENEPDTPRYDHGPFVGNACSDPTGIVQRVGITGRP